MPAILDRISRRLRTLREMAEDASWKDPRSPNYDRQWAEDALFHTIGPLTDNPSWVSGNWTSNSSPVPGFNPGGPAPRWTPDEVVMAMAGDPNLLFKSGGKDHPRSPAYGHQGGAPLFRLAKRVARIYNRDKDRQFIADMYSNGFIPLVQMMQPGFDESRSPFISYVMRNIQSAMEHGAGGSERSIRAKGGESTTGLVGLQKVLETTDPAQVRQYAEQVKGKYRDSKSHDKHPDNPFGPFSSRYYQAVTAYADALESRNEEAMEKARNRIVQLIGEIEESMTMIPGASTGMGQAISTPDRQTSVGVSSMDVQRDEESGPMAGNIPTDDNAESWIDPETINFILGIALKHDIGAMIGHLPKYQEMAVAAGMKAGDKIGGKLTANELRYIIRSLGPLGSNYPGRGQVRSAVSVPRDAPGWWKPGEDPEIEPIPSGGLWHSIWERNGNQAMGPTEITQEMTQEVREFQQLGIPSARKIKAKMDARGGRQIEEVVSKVAVSNTAKAAFIKLKLIASIHRSQLGMDESKTLRRDGFPLLEDFDPVDRRLIVETYEFILRRLARMIIEDSPPGMSGTVERMKEDGMKDDKAFAIAWSMYKKGAKPHKKPTKPGDKYIPPSEWEKSRKKD